MAFSKIIAESMDLTDAYNFTGTLQQNGASIGGNNEPMVSAYMNTSQTPTSTVNTKIQYNTEYYDTDSAYDKDTNYRFTVPSGKGGKYFIHATCYMFGNNNDERYKEIYIAVNGNRVRRNQNYHQYSTSQGSGGNQNITCIINLSAGDYVEFYGRIRVQSGTPSFYGASADTDRYSFFEIIRIIE